MTTQFLDNNGGKIAYEDYGGDGELVIMLPGMGALRSEYRFLAPAANDAGYRVITADLRGQGESSVNWPEYSVTATGRDLLALIEHLDLGPAHVIGTSFSPGAAVWASVERPDAIRSLVLIGPFVRDPQVSIVQKLMTGMLFNGPWKVNAWGMYYKTLYPTQQPADFDEYMVQLKTNLSQKGRFEAAMETGFSTKVAAENRLRQVQAPTLVVMGTKDPDWPDPEAEALFIAENTSAEVVMIDGAGHYPQTEMPEKTNPQIIDFLARVSSKKAAPVLSN